MKKLLAIVLIFAVLLSTFTACSNEKTIKVGASTTPHAEILEIVKEELKKQGYNLVIVEYTDYVQPNIALRDGSLDANYFQHLPYLQNFNINNNADLVSIGVIHFEPLGLYKGTASSVAALPANAKIAIPNDSSNGARALLLLEAAGVITLSPSAGLSATVADIIANPKNVNIIELDPALIPSKLNEVALGVINGNYAIAAGLNINNALKIEAADSTAAVTYGNIIAVRRADKDRADLKALLEALQSDAVKQFIAEKYKGAVISLGGNK